MKGALIVGGIAVAAGAVYFFVLRRRVAMPPTSVPAPSGTKPTLCATVVATTGAAAAKTGNPIALASGIAAAATAPLLCKGATWALKKGTKAAIVVGKNTGKVAKVYAEGYAKIAIAPAMVSYKVVAHPIDTAKLIGRDAKLGVQAGKTVARAGIGAVKNPVGAVKGTASFAKKTAKSPVKSAKSVLKTGTKLIGGFHF